MTSIIVSFVMGVTVLKEKFNNLYMPIIGIISVLMGMIIVSISDINCCRKKYDEYNSINNPTDNPTDRDDTEENNTVFKYIMGIALSVIMGVLNGVSMIPAKLDPSFNYIASFGIFQLPITYTVVLLYIMVKILITNSSVGMYRYDILKTVGAGTICGILWSFGYYGQALAVFSKLGLSIGFIAIQSCLIISSLCGMILFKELDSWRKRIQFLMGSIPIVIGIIILYISRT
jgi:glucose uptake protein GlcU